MRTLRLRVSLLDVAPKVTRTIDVPAGAVLPEVHQLLQAALGWTDSHLHAFIAGDVQYGSPDTEGPEAEHDESAVAIRSLPDRFRYLYDFGDGWEHEVEVISSGGDRPGCVGGEGACPPEDIGGPPGYAEFREAIGDPSHPEHEQVSEWAHSWGDFDVTTTDTWVRRTAGAVPAPVRLVLDLAADGVKLTPGGRLPRTFVREVQGHYPRWAPLDRPAFIEEDLFPLAVLHDLLRDAGLLRMRKGLLAPTKSASDDTEVIRRLRSSFGPDSGFNHLLITEAVATLVSMGDMSPEELADRVFIALGDGWATEAGDRITAQDVRRSLYRYSSALVGLDLLDTRSEHWSAGPSALSLLPRATGLARYLAGPDA